MVFFVLLLDPIPIGTATIAGIGIPFVTCGTANPRDRSRPYFTYPDHHPLKDVALFKKSVRSDSIPMIGSPCVSFRTANHRDRIRLI